MGESEVRAAARHRRWTEQIASGWADSPTMGAGQFCTNPGSAIAGDGSNADTLSAAKRQVLEPTSVQTMLIDGIA